MLAQLNLHVMVMMSETREFRSLNIMGFSHDVPMGMHCDRHLLS
jgi:hypothetical protein